MQKPCEIDHVINALEWALEHNKQAGMETVRAIERVEDPKLRAVLYNRLVNGFTFDQTAQVMQYTTRNIMRLWKKARAEMQK